MIETQFELVRCLARAGEFRDNDTGSHIFQVSIGCHILARAAGLPRQQTELIRYAAMMHDIGKIGISDQLLLKPGKLTPEEFEKIKIHCQFGVDILGDYNADVTKMAREIAFTHHERWDGNGYPSSLVGEQIPIEGRITAIIDVYDALTSERPYKRAFSAADALAIIRGSAGAQFDPQLVVSFYRHSISADGGAFSRPVRRRINASLAACRTKARNWDNAYLPTETMLQNEPLPSR